MTLKLLRIISVKTPPRYATSFVQEVYDAARSLNALAFRGRVVPEFDDTNIRELLLKSYRLIYQVTAQKIYTLGLIHGARDLWVLWKKENR